MVMPDLVSICTFHRKECKITLSVLETLGCVVDFCMTTSFSHEIMNIVWKQELAYHIISENG